MLQLTDALSHMVARRSGVVTIDELLASGNSIDTIRRAVTAKALVRCHSGTYRFATSAPTFEARCIAACLADEEAIVTGPAAARFWRFRHVFQPDLPIVAVSHDRTPLRSGVTIRRSNVLEAIDWVLRPDGLRLATPVRTWFDCARDLDDVRFEKLTEWVIDHHGPAPALWAMWRRLDRGGRPGLARVNRVLSQRPVWQKPSGSGLEVDVLRALERRGVSGLVRQHPIRLPNGVVVHPDGALPSIKWAVEIDHVTWHGGRLDAQRDKGRDRQLRRVGWHVDRVTDAELAQHFDATINELVDLIGLQRRQLAA